ncbi:MAG: SDR family oxidoreductase [Hyphomonas sp.]
MRVLVLGGYGLIGLAVSKQLVRAGHSVVGLARSERKGRALLPQADWIAADISTLKTPDNWADHLAGIDVVVNASGALQNGLKDDVAAVQRDAIIALIAACERVDVSRFVQISAPGADENSSTQFYRTKGQADDALKASGLVWTVLRPGLVISPHAYGGTSLIRMLAAFPYIQPVTLADVPVQTVSVDDVAMAVCAATQGEHDQQDLDLVEAEAQPLSDAILQVRAWLGFASPKAILRLPNWLGRALAKGADIAGWLGWRSALRSTALIVLEAGVQGDAKTWQARTGAPLKSLSETLRDMPSTVQERIYARTQLVMPIALIVLAGFWIASGVIGLMQQDKAAAVLAGVMPATVSKLFVQLGSVADVIIGIALLVRPLVRWACAASILLATSYLVASAVFTPHLWADPSGPMVKVFPATALALVVAALVEER